VASDRLSDYRRMRDFDATPEPAGAVANHAPDQPRFVIQQHSATRLHWDLRLEHEGVLLSWALPRGVPWDPKQNHLAVHTEDHPLEYLDFHGDIPDGQYGAGSMFVWDRGWYEPHELTDTKAMVTFHGERTRGRYAIFPTRGRDWIIHRMDPPLDPSRGRVPDDLLPMAPVPGPLPKRGAWAYELHWPGLRVLASCEPGLVVLRDVEGRDVTAAFPELRPLGRQTGSLEAVLDAVITATDGAHDLIARRLDAKSDSTRRRLAKDRPVALAFVDLLWRDGYLNLDRPWDERRDALEELGLEGEAWTTSSVWREGGADLLAAAAARGMGRILAKRRSSPYRPGEASDDWRDVRA
jgi:bifunctional non-homologous end joining protein LigD